MNRMRPWAARLMLVATAALVGCVHHRIAFNDLSYDINATKQDATIVAVIDDDTLESIVSIRALITGIAQTWDVQPGEMLKQIADVELPQMFKHYEFASTYKEHNPVERPLILKLSVPAYKFENYHAIIIVHAVATVGDKVLCDQTYSADGETQVALVVWGKAYALKSAVRHSSLDAYKKIFTAIRGDLTKVMAPAETK
jgi:hypothetical protein